MYIVKYVENGETKESQEFKNRQEAFMFQAGLLTRRTRKEDGTWDIEPIGVYNLDPPGIR